MSPPQIGIANLPNQLHKIVHKKGARFNILLVGESGCGKTSLMNTLFTTEVMPARNIANRLSQPLPKTPQIEITDALIEEKGFKIHLHIVDTPGFGDAINNKNCFDKILKFLDEQYEIYFKQDSQPNRQHSVDLRIHACLYFIPPHCRTLRRLDIETMQELGKRVNLIPVIAKSDTLTREALNELKQRVRESIQYHQIQVYSVPLYEEEEEETRKKNMELMSAMPFALVSAQGEFSNAKGEKVLGRKYPWGLVEIENEQHSDFKLLRSLLIRTHMLDLIQTTEETHYEHFRMQRIGNRGNFVDPAALEKARALFEAEVKKEEEALKMRLASQVQVEENRFRQWDKKINLERERLLKNLESEHLQLKQLMAEVESLEQRQNKLKELPKPKAL